MQEVEFIWLNGEIVPWKDAKIHVLTHALHYGTAVFEGIRCYSTGKGPAVFRLKDHMKRLFNSAKIFGMKIPYPEKELYGATLELIKANKLEECYIRPIAYLGYGKMGLNPIDVDVDVSIAVWPWGAYLGEEGIKNGIRMTISSYARKFSKDEASRAKISAHYVNSAMAKAEAINRGFDEALMLDEKGNVSEATGENVFIVKKGTLITPPVGNILEGITRASILEIAKDEGIKTAEKKISKKQLYSADEAFLTGTAAEVTPIREVDGKKIGQGKPGPVTKKLQAIYYDAIHGKIAKYEKWLDYVK